MTSLSTLTLLMFISIGLKVLELGFATVREPHIFSCVVIFNIVTRLRT